MITTLLKDIEKLERSNLLDVNDFTKIIRAVSSAPIYKHLILLDSWKDFLITNSELMGLNNIRDIEVALENLDFRDPALYNTLQKRK